MDKIKFFFIAVISLLLVSLVMNQSISSYLEQRYHFIFYPQNDIFKEANTLKVKLEKIKAILINEPLEHQAEDNARLDDTNILTIQNENNISYKQNNTKPIVDKNTSFNDSTKLEIKTKEEFLLIGDSLMQGAATALYKDLKNLGFKVTNLSKQNTGLSYKSYFNWAKTTQNALMKNANIKYLVVLLGTNDPWDIRIDGKYIKFNSPTWIEIYTQRIQEILDIAKQYNVKVLWYEIPPVKKDDLNEKLQILNQIYNEEILKNHEIFINTKSSFSKNDEFSNYIKNENNKSVKVRSDDGIHFTPNGAKMMSKLLLSHIHTKENDE